MDKESRLNWSGHKAVQIPLAIFAVLFLFSLFVMVINYHFPSFFVLTPQDEAPDGLAIVEQVGDEQIIPAPMAWKKGLMTANTLVVIGDDLFANWLPNDKIYPTVFLDNPQNFQLGALEALRYTTRVMRDKMTRTYASDKIDPDVDDAFTLLSNDPFKWFLPSAESRYKEAVAKLRSYRDRLAAGNDVVFNPASVNLRELLDQYVSLLGSINTRLSNAPASLRSKASQEATAEADLTGGAGDDPNETQVAWSRIDDNFYYAQGVAFVLRQMMVAIKYDFAEILENKKVNAQVDGIINVLNKTQFEPWVVLNGDIGSVTANHSMELHSLLENARQKMRNLNDMLPQ